LLVILIVIAAALVFFVVWMIKKRKGKKQKLDVKKGVMPVPQFRQKMTAAGFTVQESVLLYDIVASAKLENSLAFLTSYKSLDTVISEAMQKFAVSGKSKDAAAQEFLGKLLEHRKRITIQKMSVRNSLSGSKEIPAGQNVQVVLAGMGIFTTQVTPHISYFSIFSPIVRDLPVNFKWEGRRVTIFFRKINDGEYSFNTTVVKEVEDEKTGEFVLLMYHQESLYHTQRRNSVRAILKRPAHIYPIGDSGGRTFAECEPCTLSDISDDGCSVTIEGKVDMPRSVIIQFTLGGQLMSINGECRNVQYNRMRNVSRLHIKAESIPRDTKNIILSVTFGIINEDPVAINETRERDDESRQTDELPSSEPPSSEPSSDEPPSSEGGQGQEEPNAP
jgi:c-di-GMP-binding flagellar brake protein YcgR